MPAFPDGQLHLHADLRLDVDGVPAQVRGEGTRLVVSTPRPFALYRAAAGSLRTVGNGRGGIPRAARKAAQLLAEQRLTIELEGPSGPVLRVGQGAHPGAVTRAVTGPHVELRSSRVPRIGAAAASGLVLVLWWVRRASRR